ncbi:MAG TPA: TM0106 family RecB-like putative nuclease [Gaiella sp.]|nr:TM0106 family RecB-like putative nuclease [Gaiella sp.]
MQLIEERVWLSPSDVTAYLACEHLTSLSLQVARGDLPEPPPPGDQAQLVFRKGLEHEEAYLERLRADGLSVAAVEFDGDWAKARGETLEAMRAGVDVVYQAALTGNGWRGLADFLVRVETPSALGAWSYEALDTKLARHAKPAYVLQLCFYSERLAELQGAEPERIHVLLGNQTMESFRPREFAAYQRRVARRLEEFVGHPPATEPLPVDRCGICEFLPRCDAYWDAVDHLCRVAGIQRRQIQGLRGSGVPTLAALARADDGARPPGMADETFAKLRGQARLQLIARETHRDEYDLLPLEAEAGFALLPDPSPGDLFFDFEGNPFWDHDGSLEYLWGQTDAADEFTARWATDHDEERAAFESFVDEVHARLAVHPDLHVYHYAQYEITALRRMMGRYGTREAELDDLLRREVFVDLYKVVKGGLRISRPGYGLKEVEHLLGFERTAEIREGGTSIVEFERWMVERDDAILAEIAAYNREDCVATRVLRDWLLERRAEALERFGPFPPPEPVESKPVKPEKEARRALREALLDTGDPLMELAGQLLDYHDRERKPLWWAYFDRLDLTAEELVEDPEAIGGLVPVGEPRPEKKSTVFAFTYPPQQQKLGGSGSPVDPATGWRAGDIVHHDPEARALELKRGPSLDDAPLPTALIPRDVYQTKAQEEALERFGRSLLEGGGAYPVLESILRRDAFGRDVQTTALDELAELLLAIGRGDPDLAPAGGPPPRHLVIQGPPGSGKTWTSGRLIARLVAEGKSVGVASTSHRAIHKLLAEVETAAAERALSFRGAKKASRGNAESEFEGAVVENLFDNADCVDRDVVGGTAWLFADDVHEQRFDYLFVDEAGQVSLADACAMATCARTAVLVGDPQQLDQVLQGSHPGGSERSVLRHLMGDDETIPPDRGVFLERTFRLHPDVCGFVSEEFYEGRLVPAASTADRTTPLGTGLRWLAVPHTGNRQESREEAEAVRDEIARLVAAGLAAPEIKVVAPFNAQVDLLRTLVPAGVEVGTVDKFQGQEARVVLYSMASSSGDDVPRGLDFLLSRNRFNVAISRAQCLAYLVCSPRLLEVDCRTIEHMRLANALCRFVELAHPV